MWWFNIDSCALPPTNRSLKDDIHERNSFLVLFRPRLKYAATCSQWLELESKFSRNDVTLQVKWEEHA